MLKFLLGTIVILNSVQSTATEKRTCSSGEHWVASHNRRAYIRHDGVRVKATKVKGHCRENPRGYKKWYQTFSNQRPKVWGYKAEKTKEWSAEETERIYEALSVLPDIFLNLPGVKLYRMGKSKFPGNPATSNFAETTLYDVAFVYKESLAQIVAHELSHTLYRNLTEKEKTTFQKSAGWIEHSQFKGALTTKKSKKFIQPDSMLSVVEDFSNHIEHFLFKNKSLKRESPEAYDWIKRKYGSDFKLIQRSGYAGGS